MNFIWYDLILLALFLVFTFSFLYRKRKNLKKEGLLLLYRTKLGVKIINRFGKNHRKLLNFLSWVSVIMGFVLMIGVLYLVGKIIWIYVFQSQIVKMIKIPPITPLIPYIDRIVPNLNLPTFYFIYWIIIIAIVAIFHEFAHAVFAVNKNVKIKSTGFGFFPFFLPIFLAAFVELDEKKMEKKKIFPQMAVLSAGTFANVLIAIFFFVILVCFFSLSYTPSGIMFDTYTYSVVGLATISSVNNISLGNASYEQILNLVNGTGLSEIDANNTRYFITKSSLEGQSSTNDFLILYDDAPAVKANLSKIIVKINGINIDSREKLVGELLRYSPGENITITNLEGDAFVDHQITLAEYPGNKTAPYLGIGFIDRSSSGIVGRITSLFSFFRDPNVYYKANFGFAEFIYNLLWWLILISFSVALVNMLPVGIFDGGRFFYLTVLAITKNKNIAKKTFGIVTYLFLLVLVIVMFFWAVNIFG